MVSSMMKVNRAKSKKQKLLLQIHPFWSCEQQWMKELCWGAGLNHQLETLHHLQSANGRLFRGDFVGCEKGSGRVLWCFCLDNYWPLDVSGQTFLHFNHLAFHRQNVQAPQVAETFKSTYFDLNFIESLLSFIVNWNKLSQVDSLLLPLHWPAHRGKHLKCCRLRLGRQIEVGFENS